MVASTTARAAGLHDEPSAGSFWRRRLWERSVFLREAREDLLLPAVAPGGLFLVDLPFLQGLNFFSRPCLVGGQGIVVSCWGGNLTVVGW